MRPKPEIGKVPHVNVLLYGPGGSGKTTGALSAPGGLLALNFDQANSTYFARTFLDPEGRIMEPEVPEYDGGARNVESFMNEVALEVSNQGDGARMIDTVTADPIGQLHRRLMDDFSKRALKPHWDFYNEVNKTIERWARFMCDMPVNFVMVAHEITEKDEASGEVERLPFSGTTGKGGIALSNRLIEMVDVVGYTGRKQDDDGTVRYVAQLFNGGGRRGKDRFGVLGDYRELNLSEWFEAIGNPLMLPDSVPVAEPRVEEAAVS